MYVQYSRNSVSKVVLHRSLKRQNKYNTNHQKQILCSGQSTIRITVLQVNNVAKLIVGRANSPKVTLDKLRLDAFQ